MSRSDLNISRWLEAHSDRSAGLTTFSRNLILADIAGDGDYRLALLDLKFDEDVAAATTHPRCRLKVYKGTVLVADQILSEAASALVSFHTDEIEPRVPAVAVSCNSDLLIYKNNKPFFKFTLPPLLLAPLEIEAWNKFAVGTDDEIVVIINDLKSVPFGSLSARSQQLLTLSSLDQTKEYIARYAGTHQPTKYSTITCMSTLNKNSLDKLAVACPILGTESGHIFILDPQVFTILHQANVCNKNSTPNIIKSTGIYDVEFRIVIACRENNICLLRRKWVEGKSIIQLTDTIVDMILVPGDNFIIIATSTKLLHCYTKRGQRLWSITMINHVTCLSLIPLKHLSTHLTAVGMKGGLVHLYQGRHAVDYTTVPDTPAAIAFGQLGQEEHVMVVVTLAGTINFKILKRTADFNLSQLNRATSPSASLQSKPLPLPKRSKLFLEQSLREKDNPVDMHQTFQQGLVKLRLTAARCLVQNLSDQTGIGNEKEQVKLSAQVLGLGPKFTLILTLENMHTEKPIVGFSVVFHANPSIYTLSSYITMVPLIPPGLSYKMMTKANETQLNQQLLGGNDVKVIRVFVNRHDQVQPVLAATINMPPIEMV